MGSTSTLEPGPALQDSEPAAIFAIETGLPQTGIRIVWYRSRSAASLMRSPCTGAVKGLTVPGSVSRNRGARSCMSPRSNESVAGQGAAAPTDRFTES